METTCYKVTFLSMYQSSQYFENLTQFAVIWVKNGQKSGYFFTPDNLKMAPAKEKRKWEKEQARSKKLRRRRERSNGCNTLSFL